MQGAAALSCAQWVQEYVHSNHRTPQEPMLLSALQCSILSIGKADLSSLNVTSLYLKKCYEFDHSLAENEGPQL